MAKTKEIAILYSGGTDSTCVAALMTEKFDIIHLLTYERLGFFSVNNTRFNAEKLRNRFASKVFLHKIINVDRLFKHIYYHKFAQNIFRFGFFIGSGCLLCPLVHHIRTLIYCLDNGIVNVADGVTRELPFFPSHMEKVIEEFKKLYAVFGITYHTPVYDFSIFPSPTLLDKVEVSKGSFPGKAAPATRKHKPTGRLLVDMGLMTSENVKGSALDRRMQMRCFQFMLHNVFVYWYYMPRHSWSEYEQMTVDFFRNKLSYFIDLFKEYPSNPKINFRIKSLCRI